MTSKKNIARKLHHERRVVRDMIGLYCRHIHRQDSLCEECQKLADYADERTLKCPFMAEKSFCSQCKIHCYKPEMRERIRQVMRYAGPRMILRHPMSALRHMYYTIMEKLNSNK